MGGDFVVHELQVGLHLHTWVSLLKSLVSRCALHDRWRSTCMPVGFHHNKGCS